jgi:hypothetical protein
LRQDVAVNASEPRTRSQRQADTLEKLRAPVADVWVSTASVGSDDTAEPYLVPLSLAWIAERVVIAVETSSRTAGNIAATGTARLALGPTRDVVIIDATLEQSHRVPDAPAAIAEGYAAQADWDPRSAGDGYRYLVLRPQRIQAWREVDELRGRLLMRDGRWL